MTETITDADSMLRARGASETFDEFVTGLVFDRASGSCAFALGDGRIVVRAVTGEGGWKTYTVHDGAILSIAADVTRHGILTGGDDGVLSSLDTVSGESTEIAGFGMMKWVEHVLAIPDAKAPIRAAVVGKTLALLDGNGKTLRTLTHPSSVTGIATDAKGRRIAASHYNGVSVWFVRSDQAKPQSLEWKGSHIGIAVHPAFDSVVTSMQENSLHGWKMPEASHMRMSGYPAKSESIGFTHSGKWLASSGAESIVLWPFFGGGPMGKAPLELAGGDSVLVRKVACHPEYEVVAAGFADGMVVVADIGRERILPVAGPGRGAVSALGWSPDGATLAFGTETGFAAMVDFTSKG